MTALLEKAFNEVHKLPSIRQDALASIILEELASENKWLASLEASEDQLAKLADEALKEFESGSTQTLDPDKL